MIAFLLLSMLSFMVQWIEALSTDTEAMNRLAQNYQIHPLALEDCLHRDQRAKLEDYESHQLLVWFLYTEKKIFELQFLLYPDTLILVSHDPPPKEKTWKEYLRLSEGSKDVLHFLYQVLDRITDVTAIEIRSLFARIQDFEQNLFKGETEIRSILPTKKRLASAEMQMGHLPSVTLQLQNFFRPTDNLKWKFRDLHDHTERLYQSIVFHQGQIAGAFELYWAVVAQKTNLQVKKLTALAAIAVPISVWASFWGMNFQAIPFESPTFFAFAMTVMFGSVIALFFILKSKGYFSR